MENHIRVRFCIFSIRACLELALFWDDSVQIWTLCMNTKKSARESAKVQFSLWIHNEFKSVGDMNKEKERDRDKGGERQKERSTVTDKEWMREWGQERRRELSEKNGKKKYDKKY